MKFWLSAGVTCLLAACAAKGPDATSRPSRLIIGYDREPDSMNRFSTHILEDIHSCIVEGLTTTDENMNTVPLLAEIVPSVENGLVRLRPDGGMDVTWKLRPDIRWHDGVPLTSADVKFTVEAINDPAWNPESTDGFDRISSVDTPDPLTAIVHYKEHYAPFENQFLRGTLPKHVLEGKDIERSVDYNRNPLGTGPYRLKEWKAGEYILLERVPDYWRGSQYPFIDQLVFRFLTNQNTRIQSLAAGEVQLVGTLPWDKVPEVEKIAGIRIYKTPANSYEHFSLNQKTVPAFRDRRVRQALAHAIDRESLAQTILHGLTPVIHSPIQPMSWAFNPDVKKYAFDPARARALLAESGWKDRLSFTLITMAGNVVRERMAQAIQAQLEDVGVDMKIQLFDSTTLGQMWFEGRFDAFMANWTMPSDPEITLFFAGDRTPPRGRNVNYYSNPELDQLLYASDQEIARDKRRALLLRAQALIAEDVPELFLYNRTFLNAVPVDLENFRGNPTNTGIFWNVHEWRLR
jgi:peptide/nickel transport system substrate-binding protein